MFVRPGTAFKYHFAQSATIFPLFSHCGFWINSSQWIIFCVYFEFFGLPWNWTRNQIERLKRRGKWILLCKQLCHHLPHWHTIVIRVFFENAFQIKCSFAKDIFTHRAIYHGLFEIYIFEKENWENGSICPQMWFPKNGWISSVCVYCLHVESFVHSTIVLSWRRQYKQTAHTFSDYGWIKVYQIVIKIRCTIKKEYTIVVGYSKHLVFMYLSVHQTAIWPCSRPYMFSI